MKKFIWLLIPVLIIPAWLLGQKQADKKKPAELATRNDSLSYALGMDIGDNLKQLDVPLNAAAIYQGLADATNGAEGALTEEQVADMLKLFQVEAQKSQMKAFERKKAEGELFLQENQSAEGVKTTASGLQYQILREGTGPSPVASSTVRVHYEGRLLSDEIFDSSYARNEPVEFPLNGVIRGWTEGLQLMKVGAKFRFFIPYQLGYGERGSPPVIGPYEVLVFDVELLGVK
ncbi:MAG: FKBP-type peptidyl-prolyl cis-trans isomerase [Bacteroidetes bacterium]|nr:MAG: FKBP-type peptidyl-prolyl cis-trans isomerase [Bacteroidota bacterium]